MIASIGTCTFQQMTEWYQNWSNKLVVSKNVAVKDLDHCKIIVRLVFIFADAFFLPLLPQQQIQPCLCGSYEIVSAFGL